MEEIVEEEEDITTRTSTEDQVGRSLIVMLGRREEVLGVDVREDRVGNKYLTYISLNHLRVLSKCSLDLLIL